MALSIRRERAFAKNKLCLVCLRTLQVKSCTGATQQFNITDIKGRCITPALFICAEISPAQLSKREKT